jgi:hypothetical protein
MSLGSVEFALPQTSHHVPNGESTAIISYVTKVADVDQINKPSYCIMGPHVLSVGGKCFEQVDGCIRKLLPDF